MRILAFVDTHETPGALKRLKEKVAKEKADLAVCAGDFTVFGKSTRRMLEEMAGLGVPVVLIHGNHEDEDEVAQLAQRYPDIHLAHGTVVELLGMRFIGFGGHGFRRREEEFERIAQELSGKFDARTILVSHPPPYGTALDEVEDGWHVGCETLREIIARELPMLAICGHIHQCFHRRDRILTTPLINPGPEGEIIEVDL